MPGNGRVEPDGEPTASGTARLLQELRVRRNLTVGFGLSGLLTVLVYARYVIVPDFRSPSLGSLALSFILAVSLGALLAAIITMGVAHRLATRE